MGVCKAKPIDKSRQLDFSGGDEALIEGGAGQNKNNATLSKDKVKAEYLAGLDSGDENNQEGGDNKADEADVVAVKLNHQSSRSELGKKLVSDTEKGPLEQLRRGYRDRNSLLLQTKATTKLNGSIGKKSEMARFIEGNGANQSRNSPAREKSKEKANGARSKPKVQALKNPKRQVLSRKLIYSNNNLVEIDHLLKEGLLNNNDPDQVVFEGRLLKYKPGTSFNWIERWVQVTRTEFKYYKTRWNASCKDVKPLYVVPVRQLIAVYRVNLELPEIHSYNKWKKELSSNQKKFEDLYQLEVFGEDSEYPYKDECNDFEEDYKSLKDENEGELGNIAHNLDLEEMKGYRLWNEYQEKKLQETPNNARRKGYLMRPPHRSGRGSSGIKSVPKQSRDVSVDGGNRSMGRASAGRVSAGRAPSYEGRNQRDLVLYMKYKAYSPPQVKKLSSNKKTAVYKWIKDIQAFTSWSGREREWYYSEKRLLFATPNEREREIWVSVLNYLFRLLAEEEPEELQDNNPNGHDISDF